MNMKKIIIIASICIIIVSAVLSFFHFFKPAQNEINESIRAVPVNSLLIVEINDFNALFEKLSENKLYKELLPVENLGLDNSLLSFMKSLSLSDENIKKLCSQKPVLMSYHLIGQNRAEQLVICNVPSEEKDKSLEQNIIRYFETIGKVKTRNYDNSVIHDVNFNDCETAFTFSVYKGLFICSYSSLLVESSVRQLENEIVNVLDFPDYNIVYQTAGKKEIANIYINKKQFAGFLKLFTNKNIHNTISNFEYYGSWSELDLILNSDIISLTGFSYISDTIVSFLNVLNSQSSSGFNSLSVLPDGTAFYMAMSVNNAVRYDQYLTQYLSHINKSKSREESLSEIKSNYGVDIKEYFYPLVNNEVVFAVTNVNILDIFQNSFVIMGTRSKSQAENELNNMLKVIANHSNTSHYDYIEDVQIDESGTVRIYSLPFEKSGELLFGPIFANCSAGYISFVNNFMVFANNKESLFRLVHDALLNRTLETSIAHNKFLDNFSSKSNLFCYFSMHTGSGLLEQYLEENSLEIFADNYENFKKMGLVGYQVSKSQNLIYNNFVVKHSEESLSRPQTVWESRLDNRIKMKPAICINHNNNAREIVVQDIDNKLYLLSNSGRELWKIELEEEIISQIYQIDYYHNGRLQLLFSTESAMHIVDRLGNYVENYPLNFRAKSTAPIALFDYDNNKNYRIFVPCEDNRVYLYDIEGNIIKGWDFETTENTVHNEVSFYRNNNEDYIVFNDRYKAYFVSRRGESKIDIKTSIEFSPNNRIILDDLNTSIHFFATDINGIVHIINSDGETESIKIKEFSQDHFFTIADINRNGSNDFVFVDKNTLEVFDQNKRSLFRYDFPGNIAQVPNFYMFPRNQIKIGIVCNSTGKIYLLNQDGSLYNGFPLHGLTQFSIAYLSEAANKFNLIVGGPDNLLYNYEVNED
jgi:hypothetical protein